jgi:hypothetical protein
MKMTEAAELLASKTDVENIRSLAVWGLPLV